ncbi:MAG: NAD/NADP octopine/nopaline dehydrogenase family protein [Clostridiaceae bacterium]
MEITIVGTGNGGTAAAAHLSLKGHKVNVLKVSSRESEHFETMKRTKKIKLTGIYGDHVNDLNIVTDKPELVIPNADIILVYYVTNYHDKVADKISKYLRDNQIIYICPGYMATAIFTNKMESCKNKANPIFVEGETIPYSCRIKKPGLVSIVSDNYRHPVAVIPKEKEDYTINILQNVIGNLEKRDSIFEVSLHNPNVIIHTIGTLMNISKVEDKNIDYAMYKDGFSKSTWKIVKALDDEKCDVLGKMGYKKRTYFDEFLVRTFKEKDGISNEEGFKIYASQAPSGPNNIDNRYITEDIPMGLGLLSYLGNNLEIKTPVADMLIMLASLVLSRDFTSEVRTAEKMGFKDFNEYYCKFK